MNLGQTMITMGMFILLVMSVISANRMLMQNTETAMQTEALTESATIANDLFAEAQGQLFDKLVDTTRTDQSPSDFSTPPGGGYAGPQSEWGPSAAERASVPLPDSSYIGNYRSLNGYNDVDDYDGYTRIVSADTTNGIRIGGYLLTVRVFYVDPNNPDVKVNYQTYVKRIEIDVEHAQYLPKVTYSSLMAY